MSVDNEFSPEQEHAAYAEATRALDDLHLETLRRDPDDLVVATIRQRDGETMVVTADRGGTRYVVDQDGDYHTTESGTLVASNSDEPRPGKALQIAERIREGSIVDVQVPETDEVRLTNIEIASALFELRYPEGADGLNEDDIRIERPDGGVLELHHDPDTKIETLIDKAEQEAGESGEYRILGGVRLVSVDKEGKLRFAPEKAHEYAEAIKNGKQV